jgi:hypothetical protein
MTRRPALIAAFAVLVLAAPARAGFLAPLDDAPVIYRPIVTPPAFYYQPEPIVYAPRTVIRGPRHGARPPRVCRPGANAQQPRSARRCR